MNNSNFIQTGGYPLNAERLKEQQTAYAIFNSLGALAGNLTIISGCTLTGSFISDGVVFINGEVIDFREATVTEDSTVIIIEEEVKRPFKNGNIKTVNFIRYATFGTAETSWLWSDFMRPMETKVLTTTVNDILNRLVAAELKLDTIQSGAEVNVAANWNVTDPLSDAYIHNKPVIKEPFLYKGIFNVGNPNADQNYTVNFPSVGTSNYFVLGGFKSNSGNPFNDNDILWAWASPSNSSYILSVVELGSITQNVSFYYVLIPL